MIVGTAGHIDHGKSSLVRALTGTDPDRLKEEKERGITIDLGYAYWPRPDGDVIGFVDVPGHEALIHNMLAGATGIDFVLLVVAADDGVMPQTREHVAILDLLGHRRGLVAMTKADLADGRQKGEVLEQIAALLEATGLAGSAVVPVSVETGEGLAALAQVLDEARTGHPVSGTARRFRLDIDRSFNLPGAGTVVTGMVVSGSARVGDQLLISPSGIEARVRSLHAQNRERAEGRAGERCALALAGPAISKAAITRGQALVDPLLHAPSARIDVSIRVLASERKALSQWQPLRFHHGAAETGAHVVALGDPLSPGRSGLAQLVLDEPIAAMAGDRFILRDWSATRTLGGGTIHDLRPPERKRRTPERIAELEALAAPDAGVALAGFLNGQRGWIELAAFLRDRGLTAEAGNAITADLGLVTLGPAAMLPERWDDYRQRLLAFLDAFHLSQPDLAGVGIERMRLGVTPRLPAPVFAKVLARLASENDVALDRARVRRPAHAVKLSDEEERLWAAVRPRLNGQHRFNPPRVRDIGRDTGMNETALRRLFKLVARRGETDEIAPDHFFLGAAIAELAGAARDLARSSEHGQFNVIAFRDRIGGGRKVAIHILEYFDRQGFTMRRGDWRRINPHKENLL